MLVAPSMGPTVVRSSLEVMLDSLRQKDEKPKDVMPALPIRPISKGRLPSSRRPPPVKFNIECNGFEDQKMKENSINGQPHVADAVVEELQSRVWKAEAALKVKEEENLALNQQIQQYETRWSDYEAKMKTMEEMWQKKMASLQMSLAEAKRSLAANDRTNQQDLHDKSPNNHYFGSEDTTSQEFQTPESTPAKQPRASAAVLPVNSNGTQAAVSHMVKEFEQKKKDFEDNASLLVEVKSGQSLVTMNPDEELQKLKVRFTSWKKDYKVKLRETKAELHKIGNLQAVKTRRRWWSIWIRR